MRSQNGKFEIATTISQWPVAFFIKVQEDKMFTYIWPILLVIIANVMYQVGAKEIPTEMDGLATLTITYAAAAVTAFVLYFVTTGSGVGGLIEEYTKINGAVIMFGISAVGLEVGYVFAYKNGWEVSKAYIVQSAALSALLLFAGYLLYSEAITWNKIVGIIICTFGIFMINRKRGESV